MERIYICHSLYHVYISILKEIHNKKQSDILICASIPNYINLKNNIIKYDIFNNVYIIDETNIGLPSVQSIKRFIFYNIRLIRCFDRVLDFDFNEYSDIIIYCDHTLMGRYLNAKKIHYILNEDGLNVFKKEYYQFTKKFELSFIDRILILFRLKFPCMGRSKYMKMLEVNDADGITLDLDNIVEVPRDKLLFNLTDEDKVLISNIFINSNIKEELYKLKIDRSILVLTQPLYADNLVSSELMQISIYRKIIDDNKKNYRAIYIKPHPRDSIDYSTIFENCTVIPKDIPIEVLNFDEALYFDKVITITSTALDGILFCDNKVKLGEQYLNYMNESNHFD